MAKETQTAAAAVGSSDAETRAVVEGVERGEGVQSTSPRISHDIFLPPQAPDPW